MGSESLEFAVKWPIVVEGESYPDLESLRRSAVRRDVLDHLVQLADPVQTHLEVRSSGSTGEPKMFSVPKPKAWISAEATASALDLRCGDRVLLALDPGPIGGRMVLVRALALGLELSYCDAASLPVRPEDGEEFDLVSVVPRQLAMLLTHAPERLARMGKILVGGAPLSPELEQQCHSIPVPIWQTFGMTETLSHVALRRLNGDSRSQVYEATGEVRFSVDTESRLIIHAPQALTDPLVTNDVVRLISPTSFEWRGRADFVINSGGLKISPEELEAELAKFFPGRDFAVVGVPDEEWGERVELVVVGELLDFSNVELRDSRSVPKSQRIVTEIPRLKGGKINRLKLKQKKSEPLP
ncbi:MAG: AMP-binding protein [Fimbriimonadaceae bacterium]|nr:AMP-binding protein [Fimbriimonadaceae bacterium]